jgi:hypothetical protein
MIAAARYYGKEIVVMSLRWLAACFLIPPAVLFCMSGRVLASDEDATSDSSASQPSDDDTTPAALPKKKTTTAKPSSSRSTKTRPATRKAKLEELEAAQLQREEAERERIFKKTGIRLWPTPTEDQQKQEVDAEKKFLDEVVQHYPQLNMRLQETRYFLFLSILTPAQAAMYTPYLDAMYEELCKAYAIKNHDKVWLGKAAIIVFGNSQDFAELEQQFFNHTVPQQSQGLAHLLPTGRVVVSCYCGTDPAYFAGVLVHETTHGFNFRYKSPQTLPTWLDEGIADWTAISVVPKNRGARARARDAIIQAKKVGNLGGDFFTAELLVPLQYGIAADLVDFMLKSNAKSFRALLDGIKLGEKWPVALKKAYGVTPDELILQFGRSIGVPYLTP